MKVYCKLCGKKYDVKRENYSCPYCCASYHEEDYKKDKEGKKDKKEKPEAKQKTTKNNNKTLDKKKIMKDVVIWIIAIFLFVVLWNGSEKLREKRENYASNAEAKIMEMGKVQVEPEKVELGQVIYTENDELIINDCYINHAFDKYIPQGYEAICVEYNRTEVNHVDILQSIVYKSDIFIVTRTGESILPMERMGLKNIVPEEDLGEGEATIRNTLISGDGIFVFLVKEGTADYIEIQIFEGELYTRKLAHRFVYEEVYN